MPSGLESIWTYVDPSTMQGVAAGVVLAVFALVILVFFSYLGRLGLLAEGESQLDDLCRKLGFERKAGWLRPRVVAVGSLHQREVVVVLRFRRGRAHWVVQWKHGGGRFVRMQEVSHADVALTEWLESEVSRAIH